MENIAKSSLIAFCILIKLAVICAHLHLLCHNLPTLGLGCCNVLLQGATATEIRNLRLGHPLAFLRDKHLKRRQVSLLLNLLLGLLLLRLNASLHRLYIPLQPPFGLQLSHFLLIDGLLPLRLNLRLDIARLRSRRSVPTILLVSVLYVVDVGGVLLLGALAIRAV